MDLTMLFSTWGYCVSVVSYLTVGFSAFLLSLKPTTVTSYTLHVILASGNMTDTRFLDTQVVYQNIKK